MIDKNPTTMVNLAQYEQCSEGYDGESGPGAHLRITNFTLSSTSESQIMRSMNVVIIWISSSLIVCPSPS